MANKSLSTRQKMTFRIEAPKPRNPLVVPAGKRKAGSHAPDQSALRQAEKRKLKKLLDES